MRWLRWFLLCLGSLAWAQDPPLRVGVGNFPPYSYLVEGEPAGIEIDILRELESIDPGLRFTGLNQVLLVKRVVTEVDAGRIDLALSARTPERLARYQMLEPPIHTARLRLLGRRDEALQIDNLEQLAELGNEAVVLVAPGSSPHAYLLRQAGLSLDAAPIDSQQMLQKLLLGRGRFVFGFEPALAAAANRLGVSDQLRWQPLQAGMLEMSLLASRQLAPARWAKLNAAWKKLAASPKLKLILARYSTATIVESP
ncbi:substrate-binding periplasmic protein [Chitinimonas sp.]|uniref:substrate-binding periplasmic protein n=1 Tax=Chitinimonas sp. TaxID=1934313 RepID=UPI002F92DE50